MTASIFEREGAAIAYEKLGTDAEVVILAHGFGLDRESMRPLADALKDQYRCLIFDWRGQGETTAPEIDDAYSYPILRDDLLGLMDHLGIERAHLIGHSMGGQIALMAAIHSPSRIRSLVTIGAGPCRKVTDPKEETSWRRGAAYFEKASQPELVKALVASAPPSDSAAFRPDPARLYAAARGADLARMMRGAFLNVESNDEACGKLAVPVLVVVGEDDAQWRDYSRKLHQLVPGSRFFTVPGAGHLAHLEQPDPVLHAISDFLRQSPT